MKKDALVSGGTTEYHLIIHLFPELKQLFNYPGATKELALSDDTVVERLPVALKANLDRICVLFDAEQLGAQRRWESVRSVLEDFGYSNLPIQMPQEGLVAESDGMPRVGVWIMPDNVSRGMLEDFYINAVPRGNREFIRSQEFVEAIPSEERLFRAKTSKATFAVWLAIQDDPMSPAQSISRNLISRTAGQLPAFEAWLRILFREELDRAG